MRWQFAGDRELAIRNLDRTPICAPDQPFAGPHCQWLVWRVHALRRRHFAEAHRCIAVAAYCIKCQELVDRDEIGVYDPAEVFLPA